LPIYAALLQSDQVRRPCQVLCLDTSMNLSPHVPGARQSHAIALVSQQSLPYKAVSSQEKQLVYHLFSHSVFRDRQPYHGAYTLLITASMNVLNHSTLLK
jgi:hypothetical protein